MVYIFESELPENKSVLFALKSVFGIGKSSSEYVCKKLGVSSNLKVKDLSKDQINKLIKVVEFLNITISSDLKKTNIINSKKLLNIKSYRGFRKSQGLPVRGQRTHTNARTAKKRK